MMTTRLNTLAKGFSGVRERVVDLLVEMVNAGVHPVVRSHGSLGASGDLAPLAHMTLVLIGEGEAVVDGERVDGATALERAGLEPLDLRAKEGLALINGTQLTVSLAALTVRDVERAFRAADVAGAMTTEATNSTTASSHSRINDVRPHRGHRETADNVLALTADSGSSRPTGTATGSRTRTRSAAFPRFTGRSATPCVTCETSSRWNSTARPTIRSSSMRTRSTPVRAARTTRRCCPAETSTANRWRCPSIT